MWGVAGDHLPGLPVIEAERGNPAVLSVKHSGLAIRGRRRKAAEPATKLEVFAQQSCYRRAVTLIERADEIRVCERIDLKHDQPALRRSRPLLARECAVLGAIVPPQQRAGSGARAALRQPSRRSI